MTGKLCKKLTNSRDLCFVMHKHDVKYGRDSKTSARKGCQLCSVFVSFLLLVKKQYLAQMCLSVQPHDFSSLLTMLKMRFKTPLSVEI